MVYFIDGILVTFLHYRHIPSSRNLKEVLWAQGDQQSLKNPEPRGPAETDGPTKDHTHMQRT